MNNEKKIKGRRLSAYSLLFIAFIFAFVVCALLLTAVSNYLQARSQHVVETLNYKNDIVTVVIDAGHGGEDGGAVSDSGICEKDINLDISKKLENMLLLSDLNVVMIREDDHLMYVSGQENRKKFHDISNRIKTASAYDNAIFVSIHQNKFPIRKYSGFQVYYSKNNPASAEFASIIRDNVKNHLQPNNNRETKKADSNIRILDSLKMPAVLAECGFLSNEREAALLNTEEYRNKIAYLIYISVMQYVNEM